MASSRSRAKPKSPSSPAIPADSQAEGASGTPAGHQPPWPCKLGDAGRAMYACLEPADAFEEQFAMLAGQAFEEMQRWRAQREAEGAGNAGLDRAYTQAERSMKLAIDLIQRRRRDRARASTGKAVATPAPAEVGLPVPEESPERIAEAAHRWRDRIAIVPSLYAEWPVLLKTGYWAEGYASELASGVPEDELLRRHRGLTRSDLAAVRACEAEGLIGPLDEPYPPGLRVITDWPVAPSGP